jgi:hypothetical protein
VRRLGELLVADGLVLPAHVERSLAQQQRRGMRLGSILIDAGLATPDAVARALGRQRTVPAALERHLAANDPTLAALIPTELARRRLLVPLARSKDGGLVVAMRDPTDADVRAQVVGITGVSLIAAVAAELVLRRHVDRVYPAVYEDVDVDLESQAIPIIPDLGGVELGPPTDILDPETVRGGPAEIARDFLDPETIRAGALVSLDDVGVSKDPGQSDPRLRRQGASIPPRGASYGAASLPPRAADGPASPSHALAGSGAIAVPRVGSGAIALPRGGSGAIAPALAVPPPTVPPRTDSGGVAPAAGSAPRDLAGALARVATATTPDAVATAVVEHARAAGANALLLLAVRAGMAFGDAGFAPELTPAAIQAIAIPLNLPSLVKTAVDGARTYTGRPPVGSSVQDRLLKLLGKPGGVVVAPITAGGRVASVLVAACATPEAADALAPDIVELAAACAGTYARLRS